MKTAIIPEEGEAVLLNCLDHQADRGFYEIRLINNQDTSTHCRWIPYTTIKENEDI